MTIPIARHLLQKNIREIIAITPGEGDQAERLFSLPVTVVNNWPELADYETLKRLGQGAFDFVVKHFDPVGNPRRIIERMRDAAEQTAGRGT